VAGVPHPTTLMKITTRCGEAAVAGLNETLLAKAAGQKLLRMHKVRADTTVVPANVDYPTDSGLLAKAVAKMGRTVRRVQGAGAATRTRSGSAAFGGSAGSSDRLQAAVAWG
jgi:IS5 family transposase